VGWVRRADLRQPGNPVDGGDGARHLRRAQRRPAPQQVVRAHGGGCPERDLLTGLKCVPRLADLVGAGCEPVLARVEGHLVAAGLIGDKPHHERG
jgi:hypothetical protein